MKELQSAIAIPIKDDRDDGDGEDDDGDGEDDHLSKAFHFQVFCSLK